MLGSLWENLTRFFFFVVISSDTAAASNESAMFNCTDEDVDEQLTGRGRYVETCRPSTIGKPPEVAMKHVTRATKRATATNSVTSFGNKTDATDRRAAEVRGYCVTSSEVEYSEPRVNDFSSLPAKPTRHLSEDDETFSELSDARPAFIGNADCRKLEANDEIQYQFFPPTPALAPTIKYAYPASLEIHRTTAAGGNQTKTNYDSAPMQTAREMSSVPLYLYERAPALSSDVETDAMLSSNYQDASHASLCSAQETPTYPFISRTSERSSLFANVVAPSQGRHRFGDSWGTSERSRSAVADPSRTHSPQHVASNAFTGFGADDRRMREQRFADPMTLIGTSIVQQCTEDDRDVGFAGERLILQGNTGNGSGRAAGMVVEQRRSPVVTSLQSSSSSSSSRRINGSDRTPDIDAILSENLTLHEANIQQANTICSLRKEIETLCRQSQSKTGDRGYAVGGATNMDDQMQLRIALLEEQIETFREDFHNERKDKERALAEKRSLIQQTTDLLNELRAAREKITELQSALNQLAPNRH